MRTTSLAAAAALVIASAGCIVVTNPIEPPPRAPYEYRVGSGDVLGVEIWKEVDLVRQKVTVMPDGLISFPLAGFIDVSGKTLAEVAEIITQRLRKYLTEPFVTVTLEESRSVQVQVIGEVARQGAFRYTDNLTLVQVLAQSGILWQFAKTEVVAVVRGALDAPQYIPVDLDLVLYGLEKDIWLRPGDIVVVPAKKVTRFDRYVSQLLSPLRAITGGAREAAATATPGGGF